MLRKIKRVTFAALLAGMIFGKIQQLFTQNVFASEYDTELNQIPESGENIDNESDIVEIVDDETEGR